MLWRTKIESGSMLLTLSLLLAACSFPSVEYEQECAPPTSCQNSAAACRKQADTQQTMCLSKCKISCDCPAEFADALQACAAKCDACSVNAGCDGATDMCKALVGAP